MLNKKNMFVIVTLNDKLLIIFVYSCLYENTLIIIKAFLVFQYLRWSASYQKFSEWPVTIKCLENIGPIQKKKN